MTSDAASRASQDAASAYPILDHADRATIVARRDGRAISRDEMLADIAALAALLPDRPQLINLCADRYRFIVGFAAALCRGQVTLLPPSDTPGVLRAVAADYPALYALTDKPGALAALPEIPCFAYPPDMAVAKSADSIAGAIPLVPAAQPALILFTSGSTGRPKPVAKSWGVLVHSARAAGHRLGIAPPPAPRPGAVTPLAGLAGATLIGTVPHQHSYGLESAVLLGLLHGLAVASGQPLYPADVRAAIEAAPRPRILITTPVHLRALVAEPGGMPPVDLILSATAPLPAALATQAEACFAAPLIEIYGCTEAGQVATRRSTHTAEWRCFEGVNLDTGPAEADGPPSEAASEATWASGPAVPGRQRLHDAIARTGADTFLLGGRSADLVDVAGKRTSLAHLTHQLLGIAGVTDGVFFAPEAAGSSVPRLAALAVAPGLGAEAILRALRERIDAAFLPRPLVLLDTLPRNTLGKLPRETLLRLAGREPGG